MKINILNWRNTATFLSSCNLKSNSCIYSYLYIWRCFSRLYRAKPRLKCNLIGLSHICFNESAYKKIISLICDKSFTICDFSGETFKGLKFYNFLWVQRRHDCSQAASFANCVITLNQLKVHLQTLISIPITQKRQILSCETLVANERYETIM